MALATILQWLLKYGQPFMAIQLYRLRKRSGMPMVLALLVAWAFFAVSTSACKYFTADDCGVVIADCGLWGCSQQWWFITGAFGSWYSCCCGILLGSYVLWGVLVLPAFAILTILMLRLVLHKLPEKSWRSAVGWFGTDRYCCFGVIGFWGIRHRRWWRVWA